MSPDSNTFPTVDAWLQAYSRGQPVAIMPSALAAEALGVSANAVTKNLKAGSIPSITIDERRYISADYVHLQVTEAEHVLERISIEIERVARLRKSIFYGELMGHVGMNSQNPRDRMKIGELLAQISRKSFEENGVFLSSIVHRKGAAPTSPGPGYMPLIAEIAEEYDGVDYDPEEDEVGILQRHMEAVWDYYEVRKKKR